MSDKKKTSEYQEGLRERIKGFNEDLLPILKKHKLGLGAQPVLVPSKDVAFGYVLAAKPILFDDSKELDAEAAGVEAAEPPGEKVEGELVKSEE